MSFHLYEINELYSNASGSVQFIELKVGNSNSENFWQGQTITVTRGATNHSYTFPSNLPSNTANTSVLVATQGFADLGIVVPNYIVPSGFLFVDGGTVNFASVDSVTYTALPTDGGLSVNRNNLSGINSPTNFAGVTGSISKPVAVNQAPALVQPLADQSATEDSAFSFTVSNSTFSDADAGDTLSYVATKSDGTALPAWLIFTAATRSFSGTPANSDVGSLEVLVTATDGSNASARDSFRIAVANTNDAPLLVKAIADHTVVNDAAFSFSVPASAFSDADAGDALNYVATLASGAALPPWLTFDSSTLIFSGTPAAVDIGSIDIALTATDAGNASAADLFVLTVRDASTVSGKTVEFLAYDWKAHVLLDGVSIVAGLEAAQTTSTEGSASVLGIVDSSLDVVASRGTSAAEAGAAVNLQDAIAILKLIVGLEVNGAGKALSPYQALAADFDGNGQVQLTDAIGVLKHVVGLTAPAPVWHFANETDAAIPTISALNPGAAPAISVDLSSAASPAHVGLVAYLSGDVDGSYAGIAGAQDLDTTQTAYFDNLSATYGLSLGQFGIY